MRNLNSTRIKALLLCMLCFSSSIFAQQEVMYSQYMFNTLAINPAYAGSRDVLSLTVLGRYQWLTSNIPGSPKTHSISLDMPIKNEKMGIGIAAYNDNIGVANNTGLNIAYAYRFKLGERTTMSLGLQPTITNVSLNLSKVREGIDESDPVFANNRSKILFNAGLGLFISNDRSYLGISVPQMLEQKLDKANDVGYVTKRHYFAMMGFVIGKGNFKIKPSTMIRYNAGTPLGIDGNINFWYKEKISFGISGRKSQVVLSGIDAIDAVVGMLELQLSPQIRVGYAYDYNNNRLNTKRGDATFYKKLVGTPTHEWLLRYEFGYGKSKILTPRYF